MMTYQMKKLLLIGIAALFLATGTAHSWDSHQTTFGKGYFSGLAAGFVVAAAAQARGHISSACNASMVL
jgi:hypothetical protein